MIKRTLFIILGILLCISSGFSYANFTDMYLDYNGWCQKQEINFHIYNKTDWENRKDIDRKLCDPADKCEENDCLGKNEGTDKCDPCDNCLYYRVIDNAKITIYDGPMTSRPILYETTSKYGDFSYTFPSWNGYLVKIEAERDKNDNPKQNYNDYSEILEIQACDTVFEDPTENKEEYFNHNFNYLNSEVLVSITNTTMKNDSEISVRNDVIVPLTLNNSIKILGITSKNEEYTKIDIKLKFPNNQNAETKLYKYDSKANIWNEISNFKIENGYLVLESGELGIYSITQEENQITEQESIIEEIPTIEEETENNDNKTITAVIPGAPTKNEPLIATWQIILLVCGIIGISLILYFKFGNKTKEHYHDKRNEEAKTVLTTYEQTYQETIKYVEKYKDEYSKDQLFRALKDSGVPEDIIDKAFIEKL